MVQPSKTQFGYRRHADQDRSGTDVAQYPVVVVGAGPVGLSLAIDLAQRGVPVVLLDDADRIGDGSRAINCFNFVSAASGSARPTSPMSPLCASACRGSSSSTWT